MAAISATLVKDLREKSGAGMLECKKALEENGGDLAKAMDWLREKGIASAGKKASRAANEGLVALHVAADGRKGVMVEINCETDFVARTEDFKALASQLAEQATGEALSTDPAQAASELLARPFARQSGQTVEEALKALIGKLGENMSLARVASLEVKGSGLLAAYRHADGKLGTLVALGCAKADTLSKDDFKSLGHDLALQVAGSNPPALVVKREEIDADFIAKEREIALVQAKATGKPEAILPKIAEGKVNKVLEEITLLEQPFIKEPGTKVGDLLKKAASGLGDTAEVQGFKRLKVGEK